MAGERLATVPKESQQMQPGGERRVAQSNPFGLISRQELNREQKPEKMAAQQLPNGLRIEADGITTYTTPTIRENAAGVSEGIGKFTGPGQILLGIAAIPFTAGLSGALIGSGALDLSGNDYAKSDQKAEQNKRLLDEAEENKHEVVVNSTPQSVSRSESSKPIALKPGYVEIINHDPVAKKTEVKILHEAFDHEATIFVAKK